MGKQIASLKELKFKAKTVMKKDYSKVERGLIASYVLFSIARQMQLLGDIYIISRNSVFSTQY